MAYCAERIFSGILISKFNCEPVIDNISNQRVETFLKNCHPRAKTRRCKQFWKFCPTENNEEYSLRLTGLTLHCSKEPMNKPNKGFLSSCRNRTLVNLVDSNYSKFRFYGRINHQQCYEQGTPKRAIPHTKANRVLCSPAATLNKPWRRRQWNMAKQKLSRGKTIAMRVHFLHSLTVLCKTARWSHQRFRGNPEG